MRVLSSTPRGRCRVTDCLIAGPLAVITWWLCGAFPVSPDVTTSPSLLFSSRLPMENCLTMEPNGNNTQTFEIK
ncbi:hypothetical protein CEXT_601711 [Caerostris extrusa]|uniref:Secreted protein n=1 Tax=Caerostris extrusa TaxID=172846 RepID=A0AAV4MLA0_CAEEX|nr:hypothetical protein CEXT_601711 [Caerostris extrusa]